MIQPQTISNKIVAELSAYVKNHEVPDAFTLRRLKNDASSIKNVSLAEYAMMMGMIACVSGDIGECRKQHELSLTQDCNPLLYANYFSSLFFIGHLNESFQCVEKGINLFPGSTSLLESAIEASLLLGRYRRAVKYYEDLLKLNPAKISSDIKDFVIDSKKVINLGISEETTQNLSHILEKICLDRDVRIESIMVNIDDDILMQWVETSANVDITVDMNFELCDTLARNDSNFNQISVSFRAFQNS